MRGELDLDSVGVLDRTMRSFEAETVVLDLRELRFLDSSGLKLIADHDEAVRGRGGRFLIVRPPSAVRRVFEITQTESRFEFVDDPPP